MSILLPREASWHASKGLSLVLFEELAKHVSADRLRESLAFCIDAEVDTLDLRSATASELTEVSRAIEQVLKMVDQVRLHDPAAAPFFLAQVCDLRSRLVGLLAEPERE